MNVWRKNLVPMLFAFASVAFLIPAVGPMLNREPLNHTYFTFAIVFFVLAIVFFAVGKSDGASGPPSA